MRYSPDDKAEIIRLVDQSHLSAKQTLDHLGVSRATFYRWYDLAARGGPEALADTPSRPGRIWNRLPDTIRQQIVELALEEPELSPRELAVRFTDTRGYFVCESSVYRLLKSRDLITSPAYIVMKAANEFKDKTTAPNQMWQTDFTCPPSAPVRQNMDCRFRMDLVSSQPIKGREDETKSLFSQGPCRTGGQRHSSPDPATLLG